VRKSLFIFDWCARFKVNMFVVGGFGMRKFMLEKVFANIRMKALEKGFGTLEVSTEEGVIHIPLKKINGLAFVEE
jgi:hypothetical protein